MREGAMLLETIPLWAELVFDVGVIGVILAAVWWVRRLWQRIE